MPTWRRRCLWRWRQGCQNFNPGHTAAAYAAVTQHNRLLEVRIMKGSVSPDKGSAASTFTHFAISPTHPHFFVPWGLGTKEQKTWLSQHELYLLVL